VLSLRAPRHGAPEDGRNCFLHIYFGRQGARNDFADPERHRPLTTITLTWEQAQALLDAWPARLCERLELESGQPLGLAQGYLVARRN
jgi:hypothetical protein